jgi:hypothetical protein
MQVISARGEVEENKESKQAVLEVQSCKIVCADAKGEILLSLQ